MKYVFLTIWAVLFLPLGGVASLGLWRSPGSYQSYLLIAGVAYAAVCSFKLIQEGYRSRALFGSSKVGFWLCLLLLPLCLLPLYGAYETWLQGIYVPSSSGRKTYLSSLLLEGLQALVGHWGPIIALLVFGLGMLFFLLGVIRQYRR